MGDEDGIEVVEVFVAPREISRIDQQPRAVALNEHARVAEVGDAHGRHASRLPRPHGYCSGSSQSASSSVRGPKMRRSDSSIGTSLMLASRRRM